MAEDASTTIPSGAQEADRAVRVAHANAVDALATDEANPFYRSAMEALTDAGVRFLVGGAYAFARYSGIRRETKDFDVFIHRRDLQRAFAGLSAAGYETDLTFPHWLGKARNGEQFVDIIFSSGNGIAGVDDEWFEHGVPGEVLGVPIRFTPPEEMIWSKAFVMERERYDGADIMHILRHYGARLDWQRLVDRFGPHWRLLLANLVLFGFVYPSEPSPAPPWVLARLVSSLQRDESQPRPPERVCRGTMISRAQYLIDVSQWGYQDARRMPGGNMSAEDVAHWTAAIDK